MRHHLLFAALTFGLAATAAHAASTTWYVETAPINSVDPTSSYTPGGILSGSFTTTSTIPPSASNFVPAITAYSFTFEGLTISSSDSSPYHSIDFDTDASGNITYFYFDVANGTDFFEAYDEPTSAPPQQDVYIGTFNTGIQASYQGSPALYLSTTPPSVTPEPSSLALLATGALGLAGVLRRRLS